jgi:hypothetical protein
VTRQLQAAEQLTLPALEATLTHLDLTPADAATIALARRTAAAIDNGDARITTAGPLLLATLTALGATPTARQTALRAAGGGDTSGTKTGSPRSALAQLRQARRPAS